MKVSVESHYFDNGFKTDFYGLESRNALPSCEMVGLNSNEVELGAGDSCVEIALIGKGGKSYVWLAHYAHHPDLTHGDRGNYAGVGVWLENEIPVNISAFLRFLVKSIGYLRKNGFKKTAAITSQFNVFCADKELRWSIPLDVVPPTIREGKFPERSLKTENFLADASDKLALDLVSSSIASFLATSAVKNSTNRRIYLLSDRRASGGRELYTTLEASALLQGAEESFRSFCNFASSYSADFNALIKNKNLDMEEAARKLEDVLRTEAENSAKMKRFEKDIADVKSELAEKTAFLAKIGTYAVELQRPKPGGMKIDPYYPPQRPTQTIRRPQPEPRPGQPTVSQPTARPSKSGLDIYDLIFAVLLVALGFVGAVVLQRFGLIGPEVPVAPMTQSAEAAPEQFAYTEPPPHSEPPKALAQDEQTKTDLAPTASETVPTQPKTDRPEKKSTDKGKGQAKDQKKGK